MKKIIPLLLCLLVLSGCSQRMFTPVLNTDFSKNAVCKIGDFSYNCKITKVEKCLSVEITSSRAKGMTITYDGNEITFLRDKMTKSFKANEIDSTNPAKFLFNVFNYLETNEGVEAKRVENHYEYTGKTAIGEFVLVQNEDNSIKSIAIPSADISVIFSEE